MKAKIILIPVLICLLSISCSSFRQAAVSDIEQGKELAHAKKSNSNEYFCYFAVRNKHNCHWQVLYQDTANIYFGKVKNKNLFSKTKIVNDLYSIPVTEMERDIPLYKENLDEIIFSSMKGYFANPYHQMDAVKSASIIHQGDSINYQFEIAFHTVRWEFSILDLLPFGWGEKIGSKCKHLILTDKNLLPLENFEISQ